MLRAKRQARPAALVFAFVVVALAPAPAHAQTAPLTDDELCELTPSDGTWATAPDLVDEQLSILGLVAHDVSVPNALAACSNQIEHFDGTTIDVGVYVLLSEEQARAALGALRSSAAAAAPVEDFATPLLGDEAWVAHFEYAQLAFTRVGAFLVGGHSDEAYDYSRADYSQLLIERMGVAVTGAATHTQAGAPSGGATAPPTGAPSTETSPGADEASESSATGAAPTERSPGTDDGSGGVPGALIGVGAVAAAAVAGVAIHRSLRRRRRGDRRAEPGEESEQDERSGPFILELAYPAGHSPDVFQYGWVFGARCIVDAGTSNQRDLSDRVRWSGGATFNPPVGRLSRPAFTNGAGLDVPLRIGQRSTNTITLTVEVDGTTTENTITVGVVSTAGYARVGDVSSCPADAHGCPACPHATKGPISTGSPTVLLDNLPAARVDDVGVASSCCGPNMFRIASGDPSVLIDGRPAARKGSETAHCGGSGTLITGSPGSRS